MTAALVKGWCPSLHEPMAALDGLIVRVKPRVRGLAGGDLRKIAGTAERAGAGGLELTGRGALQVRGLDQAGAAQFARAMVEFGLASQDAAVERRRNLQLGVSLGPGLRGLATALEIWLEHDDSLASLPAKFGFALSAGEEIPADLVVQGEDEDCIVIGGEAAVRANGAPLAAIERLTRAFLALAPRQSVPPRRMKGLIRAIGAAAVVDAAGLESTEPPPTRVVRKTIGSDRRGFGLGLVFGVVTPAMLRAAANLARRFGDNGVALAPGRVVWLRGVSPSVEPRLAAEAAAAGFVVDPDDRRLRLDACIGQAGCARASDDVRADALRLAWAAPADGLHVSGCAKGCAHPGPAGVTMVSTGGSGRYDLILDGAPSALPTYADMRVDEIVERLPQAAP